MKIFGFFNSMEEFKSAVGIALSEEGDVIVSHFSSTESYSCSDLGMNETSKCKHDLYNEKFPKGWEVEFVKIGTRDNHEGLQNAIKLHDKKYNH